MTDCTTQIFSSCRATRHLNFRQSTNISLTFDDAPANYKENRLSAGFGAPILNWTPRDCEDDQFLENAHAVFSRWIELDTLAMLLRQFGAARPVTWSTNQIPVVEEGISILQGPDDMPEVLRHLKHAYEAAIITACNLTDENDELRLALIHLREFMQSRGIDPDPIGVVGKMTLLKAQKEANQGSQPAK